MEHKTKMIIVVAVSFLVIIVLVAYLAFNRIGTPQIQIQDTTEKTIEKKEVVTQAEEKPSMVGKNYQESQPDMKTITVRGKVVISTKDSIEISNNGINNTLPLNENVLVVSLKDEGSAGLTADDIEKDETVSIIVNAANTEVVGIQIDKE